VVDSVIGVMLRYKHSGRVQDLRELSFQETRSIRNSETTYTVYKLTTCARPSVITIRES
jgi:hypothetical protein